VHGDPVWLTQLLFNLLDNALRHTPGGGKIALTLESAPAGEPDGAIIRINDTGEGIAPEHLPHLFERFYRTDAGRARSTGGAGLGLAICDWVAQAHGGSISVASTLGAGTTFTVWLPAVPVTSSEPATRLAAGAPGAGHA